MVAFLLLQFFFPPKATQPLPFMYMVDMSMVDTDMVDTDMVDTEVIIFRGDHFSEVHVHRPNF